MEPLVDNPDAELAEGFREDALEYRHGQLEVSGRIDRVAGANGTVLGYVSAEVQESPPVISRGDTLYINEAYVRPDYRRDGLGDTLLLTRHRMRKGLYPPQPRGSQSGPGYSPLPTSG